ncbi:MAG: hypothetical protein O3B64_03160 [bacterium]|nr:hypothetical protein [bacterium]
MKMFKEVVKQQRVRLWRIGHIGLFIATMIFGVCYIAEINRATAKGYQFRELELSIEQLDRAVSKQDSEIARLESVSRIARSVRMLELVPAQKISYIEELAPAVAFR